MMGVPTHGSRQFRFAALGIIILTVAIRLPSLLHPQPIDSEGIYSVVANEIVDGGRPYIDAVETNSIIHAIMLTAGFFAAVGLVTIVLWKQGILHEAFYWTIADHDVPHVFWQKGIENTLAFLGACLPLVIGAIMACRDKSAIWAGRTAERTAILGLLAASAIGAAAGARFYPHYYVQLIPPLALLAAPYYARLWSRTMQPPTGYYGLR